MIPITVFLPEETVARLAEKAALLGVAPEALIHASVEDLLTRPTDEFRKAVHHVLGKNAELYRRLT